MASVTQDFDVAQGRGCTFWAPTAAFIVTIAIPLVSVAVKMLHGGRRGDWLGSAIGAFAAIVASGVFGLLRTRVSRFKIVDNVLFVGKDDYPLDGLTEVVRDPAAMRGARKCWRGGDEFSGFSGTFRSKALGKFKAYVTDFSRAVVLRWPERALVISPADPEFFVLMARRAASRS